MLVLSALLLNACGSGLTDNDANGETGTLSTPITDGVIEQVSEINLRIIALQLRRQSFDSKDVIEIDLRNPDDSALGFNLLDYRQGEIFPPGLVKARKRTRSSVRGAALTDFAAELRAADAASDTLALIDDIDDDR